MNEDIEKAITILAQRITSDIEENAALKFTQAALNLAHTKQVLSQTRITDSK